MKHTEMRTGEFSVSSLKTVKLTDLEVNTDDNKAVFARRATVMSRGRGQDVIDPYRICRDFLNQQAHRRLEGSKDDSMA